MHAKKPGDGYGALLLSAFKTDGKGVFEISERDDGFIAASNWPQRYFSGYQGWTKREREAVRLVRGHVLDIGCGAGRFSLYLQKKGLEVTAIDSSRGAVKVCKTRGVKNVRLMSIDELGKFKPGSFDTLMMMGNNFGLFGGFHKAKRLLKQMRMITSERGQIIAEAVDPYHTNQKLHLDYQRWNRARGRMSGQLRFRIRHENIVGPWIDYLLVSQKEMKQIVADTGWEIRKVIAEDGIRYTAVLGKRCAQITQN